MSHIGNDQLVDRVRDLRESIEEVKRELISFRWSEDRQRWNRLADELEALRDECDELELELFE